MVSPLFLFTIVNVVVAAKGLKPPLEGYTAVPMVFRGVNITDSTEVVLSGTIQACFRLDDHPNLPSLDILTLMVQEIQGQLATMDDVNITSTLVSRSMDRESRVAAREGKIICWVGGTGAANNQPVQDGIDYLRGIGGDCSAAPGPRVCTRISCSWNAAIWFCNDTPVEKKHSCANLADFAVDIRKECHSLIGRDYVIQGQEFDADDFNVIVGADDC